MNDTVVQFKKVFDDCFTLFQKKQADYGDSWRILRTTSLTDQLYIKAKRIRSIEEKKTQKVEDSVFAEYIGLVNYSVMALMQLTENSTYEQISNKCSELMMAKNHDYDEAWRDMRMSSLTDLILSKLLRIRQIEDNDGKVIASEGLSASYYDIVNYSIFALIKLSER